MNNFFKRLWHEFWYKHWHLPRSVRFYETVAGVYRVRPGKEKYHSHHFKMAWYHGMEYQNLDPKGMHEFSEEVMKKAFPGDFPRKDIPYANEK